MAPDLFDGESMSQAPHATMPPTRSGSREISIIVKNDGTMVSQYGPCVCGAAKREWHKICLARQRPEAEGEKNGK